LGYIYYISNLLPTRIWLIFRNKIQPKLGYKISYVSFDTYDIFFETKLVVKKFLKIKLYLAYLFICVVNFPQYLQLYNCKNYKHNNNWVYLKLRKTPLPKIDPLRTHWISVVEHQLWWNRTIFRTVPKTRISSRHCSPA